MTRTPSRRRPRKTAAKARRGRGLINTLSIGLGLALIAALVLSGLGGVAYVRHLDSEIRSQFEGKRWALPARVYARPLELFAQRSLNPGQFARELELLNYRQVSQVRGPGSYSRDGDTFLIHTRPFIFWDGREEPRRVRVALADGRVQALASLDSDQNLGLLRMEPLEIAGIYPSHNEDRILVRREEIPEVLIDALIAVEDRKFYEHRGIDPKGIFRAFLANLRAGRTVQGGSTLTQQLVKNYFLTNERTYRRKINEMIMALLLDHHYPKDEILEAYLNEVYLGQDGNRAVHGLGLASRFYFGRPLGELNLHHIALLVGLIKGPSYYDPRRFAERALDRRALVLGVMVEQNLIGPEDAATAKEQPLGVVPKSSGGITRYPAFVDLVQRQLKQDYREEDLTSEGLRIFTTLDPQIQNQTEEAVVEGLPVLEARNGLEDGILEAAAIVVDAASGEIQALVGGRDVRLAGFNRALDARRPAGSLLKPAVYLTALEFPRVYTLATPLDDSPLEYRDAKGDVWSPKNYSKTYHDRVLLQESLARSYNVPTARIALDLTPQRIVDTLHRLGIERELPAYPSLALGSADLSPMDIAQMYETFASGGYRTPLRVIRDVTQADGQPLERYPLQVKKVIEPGPAYLITRAMQRVVSSGTAAAMAEKLPRSLNIAGKTGTTDDYRDSWFAGFSGNLMSVVWLGRDDFKPAKLSGSAGALRIWMDVMKDLHQEPLNPQPPPSIQTAMIDLNTGLLGTNQCQRTAMLPFIAGSVPREQSPCALELISGSEPSSGIQRRYEDEARAALPPPPPPTGGGNPVSNLFNRLINNESR